MKFIDLIYQIFLELNEIWTIECQYTSESTLEILEFSDTS